MKKSFLFTTLTALLFITGCSTTTVPSTPKPHPEKYALQALLIEVPAVGTKPASAYAPAPRRNIEALLKNPNATITELPIIYAAVGGTAINDQTETLSFPTTYEPQTDSNGVVSVVYNHHKDIKIGQYVEMTLQKVENGKATCDLWFYEKKFNGMQKYDVAPATETQDAVTASLPIFKGLEIKTKKTLTLVPGAWISMGGMENEKIIKTVFLRILPPKGVEFAPPKKETWRSYRFQ
jgi:hypothetical protein